jgi:hypothetical protein
MTTQKLLRPAHVFVPGSVNDFVPVAEHPDTNRAGLGYSILRALGAHERLGPAALEVVAKWSAKYGAEHGGVTPDALNLSGQAFESRVGPSWGAHRAAGNASCYPGGRQGRSSYGDVYREVWVEQRWPDLCVALSSAQIGASR